MIDQLDLLVAHRHYTRTDLMEMPLYERHKILYNFMREQEQQKKAMDEAKSKSR